MKLAWLMFVIVAALAWGAYVPSIHHGQLAFGGKSNPNSPMRAFLFVGVAYFLMAIVVPGLWLVTHREPVADTGFNARGIVICTIAGALGAAGALSVIFALKFGGLPIYVAPLVFAGAPIVNVIVAMVWEGVERRPDPRFFVGLLLAAAGAALVLRYKPAPRAHGPSTHGSPVRSAPAAASSAAAATPTRPA